MPTEKHERYLNQKHRLDRFTIIYIMYILLLINIGYNTVKDAKNILKSLYLKTDPSAECIQVLNYIDDNDVGFQEDIRAISTALLHPDQCPAFIKEALDRIASSFFSNDLLENIDAQILNGLQGTRYIVIDKEALLSDAIKHELDANTLINSLGAPIGAQEIPDQYLALTQIYPLDLSSTRAILSNGRDRNTADIPINQIFKIWMAQPTIGDEVNHEGHHRGYTMGLFPQFIKLNGNSLAEYNEAVNDANKMWIIVDSQGRYQITNGPINPDQYSAAPFLWRWDMVEAGPNFLINSLGNGSQDYLIASTESERIGEAAIQNQKPMTGIAVMADGSAAIISLPYYIFTDAALATFIGNQLREMGIVSVGLGDIKFSASGEGVIDPLHPRPLPVQAEGFNIPDPFENGALYLTIVSP